MINGILNDWSRVPLADAPARFRLSGTFMYVNPADKELAMVYQKGDTCVTSEVIQEIRVREGNRLMITASGSRYLCVGGCIPLDPVLKTFFRRNRELRG